MPEAARTFGSAKYSNGLAVSSGSSMGTGLFLWNEILILLLISGLYMNWYKYAYDQICIIIMLGLSI